MQNPDMLRQVLDNPLTQSLMSNPDVIRQMLESNPQMQEVMDRNPEIRQMLNNPEVLRQMMEIARNPSRLQEMTRTMDRQMQNLEAMRRGQQAPAASNVVSMPQMASRPAPLSPPHAWSPSAGSICGRLMNESFTRVATEAVVSSIIDL